MNTWIALLHGINVVGKNKLPMKEVAAVLEDAGLKATRTYIQSGNVVFRSARGTARTLSARIEKVVLEHFGFARRVIVITAADLACGDSGKSLCRRAARSEVLAAVFSVRKPFKSDLDSLARIDAGRDDSTPNRIRMYSSGAPIHSGARLLFRPHGTKS
jgi:uncharacterized protein (DUF1697 family)